MKHLRFLIATATLGALATFTVAVRGQVKAPDQAEVALRAAMEKESVAGDLKAAIEEYRKIATTYAKSNRAIAARALLRMGQCYEKLGNAEARKAYERLVMEFADQVEPARAARERLAALSGGTAAKSTEMTLRRVWSGPGANGEGGPSPDGRSLSYTDWQTPDLAIHDLITGANRRITEKKPGDPYAYPDNSVFSRDGKQIAYRWWVGKNVCEIRTIALDGSAPRVLYHSTENCPSQLDWSPDGQHILTKLGRRPVLLAVADGSLQDLAVENPGTLCFSPDGRHIAYEAPQAKDARQHDLFVFERATQRSLPLVRHPADERLLGWSPDGKYVLFSSDRRGSRDAYLIAVSGGQPQGEPVLVRSDVGGLYGKGFTRAGAYFFSNWGQIRDVFSVRIDVRAGTMQAPPADAAGSYLGSNWGPDFSRDGKFTAYVSGQGAIVVQSLETAEKRVVKPDAEIRRVGRMYSLRWAPDGRSFVAPGVDSQGKASLLRVDSLNGQSTVLLNAACADTPPPFDLSPDGKRVFYIGSPDCGTLHVWDSASGEDRQQGARGVWSFAVSPDGGQLAYFGSDVETGSKGLFVMPSAGGTPRLVVPAVSRGALAWSPDGRDLLYATEVPGAGDGTPATARYALWHVPSQGGEPQQLPLTVDGMMMSLRVHPDGQRMLYGTLRANPEVWVMENFLPDRGGE